MNYEKRVFKKKTRVNVRSKKEKEQGGRAFESTSKKKKRSQSDR